jgi:hypothetical protein
VSLRAGYNADMTIFIFFIILFAIAWYIDSKTSNPQDEFLKIMRETKEKEEKEKVSPNN